MSTARCTVLGTGTSVGIPMAGCPCPTCASTDTHDKRMRSSVLLSWNNANIVIDTTPEFRIQMLRENVMHMDAALITHNHHDHIHGLDDLRPYGFHRKTPIPVYANTQTANWIRQHYDYIWNATQRGGGLPNIEILAADEPFELLGATVIPIPVLHGSLAILGWRIGNFAYISDVSEIPPTSMDLLCDLDVLMIDAVRYKPHTTHFHFAKAVDVAQQLAPRQTWLTHLNHDYQHAHLLQECPPGIAPAHDGLQFTFDTTSQL